MSSPLVIDTTPLDATESDIITAMLDAIVATDPDMKVQVKGMSLKIVKEDQDWLSFQLLNSEQRPVQSLRRFNRMLMQLTCYSRHAEYRVDKNWKAPWIVADKFRPLMNRAKLNVKNACLQIQDCTMIHMDLRASADFAKEQFQSSTPLQLHSVVITTTAIIGF